MERKCPNCLYVDHGEHWNSETSLPPVKLPFVILRGGKEYYVIRSEYASSSSGNLTYGRLCTDGTLGRGMIVGRFPWRHK